MPAAQQQHPEGVDVELQIFLILALDQCWWLV